MLFESLQGLFFWIMQAEHLCFPLMLLFKKPCLYVSSKVMKREQKQTKKKPHIYINVHLHTKFCPPSHEHGMGACSDILQEAEAGAAVETASVCVCSDVNLITNSDGLA